ncbi:hypothetical protein AB1Y20_015198 [Prymnesium parvum]|uniref:MORN repeat-containing protein 5 n=1 Tax=Prymnesium parvum TaxID=97485 RepID=A0AB34JWC7_PRYPA
MPPAYRQRLSAAELRGSDPPNPPLASRPSPAPPAAMRFAYDGADATEGAVLHGLAAAYEGLFRLERGRLVHGRPCYRHVERRDKFIAFNGSCWMAQGEACVGSSRGVMMLRDASCATPDLSGATWRLTPGWNAEPGLRCLAMSEEEAARWEAESNPWGEGQQANEAIEQIAGVLRSAPAEARAGMMEKLKEVEARVLSELGTPELRQLQGKPSSQVQGEGVLQLRGGLLFVGSGDSRGRPHGHGELLLADGSVHVGEFENGAAQGEGVYFDHCGAVHKGSWAANRRVGAFTVVDPTGKRWADKYDASGKRTAHRREREEVQAAIEAVEGPAFPAAACQRCGSRFHSQHNYRCRWHSGGWDAANQRWSCCRSLEEGGPGCQVVEGHRPMPDL